MRLVTFHPVAGGAPRIGALVEGDRVVDLPAAARSATGRDDAVPADMVAFLAAGAMAAAEDAVGHATEQAAGDGAGGDNARMVLDLADVRLLAPVPRPTRIRDYLTFEAHASGSGLSVPEAFREMPICYKGNHLAMSGPDDEILWPAFTDQLDFELELAFYTSAPGRNIPADRGGAHIAGITIFNDVSARDIQMREMSLQIGPSKGKDFCNVTGPCLLTWDEVDEFDLSMRASVNGEVWAEGTSRERTFSLPEVVAWASYCEDLHPGELIGVGTMGGGCGLELGRWIAPGDVVELEIEGVGVLRNRVGQREAVPEGAGLRTYSIAPRVSSAHG